jgi:NADPH:quinone reductase-like Zn-dependent oxidoreductase
MGQYAVQFAKLAGLRVISTASAKNIDFVKSLGADEVFDYNDSEAYKKILDATGGTLKYALDCISEGTTPIQVTKSFGSSGGTVVTLLPYKEGTTREDVKIARVLAYTVLGKVSAKRITQFFRLIAIIILGHRQLGAPCVSGTLRKWKGLC